MSSVEPSFCLLYVMLLIKFVNTSNFASILNKLLLSFILLFLIIVLKSKFFMIKVGLSVRLERIAIIVIFFLHDYGLNGKTNTNISVSPSRYNILSLHVAVE